MYVKTLLSIVGLLFASTQVSADYINCQPTYSDDDGTCTPGTCTEGDDGYYADDANHIFQISNSADGAACTVVDVDGYFALKVGMFVSKKGGAVTDITLNVAQDSSCSGSDSVGNFYNENTFCLAQNKPLDLTSTSTKSYLYTDAGTIFTDNAAKKVIVKSIGSAVVLDSELMSKTYNYCVDDDLVVWDRKDDLCNSNKSGDCAYYQCANGECKDEGKNLSPVAERAVPGGEVCVLETDGEKTIGTNCVSGNYYIYAGEDKTPVDFTDDSEQTYTMVQCINGEQGWTCNPPTTIPIGYVPNGGKAGEYIKCLAGGTCTPVAEIEAGLKELAAGTYMIDINSSGLLGIAQETSTYINVVRTATDVLVDRESAGYYTVTGTAVDNSKAGDLYQCTVVGGISKCEMPAEKPIGYLVNAGKAGSLDFIKCEYGGVCTAYNPSSNTCTSANGVLYVDDGSIKLCGIQNNGAELILAGTSAIDTEQLYMASVATANDQLFGITNKAGYYIVLKFKDGNVTVENTSVRYRYTKKDTTLVQDRATAHTLDGTGAICEAVNGGYPNAFEYVLANWDGATYALSSGIAYYVDEDYTEA